MLLDTLIDHQLYFKTTLRACLEEARTSLKERRPELRKEVPTSYKMILERERKKIPVYIAVHRDPMNGWRMYSGKQIRDIVNYEVDQIEKGDK